MTKKTAYKGRIVPVPSDYLHKTCTIISVLSLLAPVPGISLPVIAAFTCGCQKEVSIMETEGQENMIAFDMTLDEGYSKEDIRQISVFVFNTDSLGRLDTYQEFSGQEDGRIRAATTGGRKLMVLCANLRISDEELSGISTAEDLKECSFMLEDTQREYPLMTCNRPRTLTTTHTVADFTTCTGRCTVEWFYGSREVVGFCLQ